MSHDNSTRLQVGDLVRIKDGLLTDAHGDFITRRYGYVSSGTRDKNGEIETVCLDVGGVGLTFDFDEVELVAKRPPMPIHNLPVGALVRDPDGLLGIVINIHIPFDSIPYAVAPIGREKNVTYFSRDDLTVVDDVTIPAIIKTAGELA